MRHLAIILALLIAALPAIADERPAKWAVPLPGNKIENLHRVTPSLYRSAQPDAAGLLAAQNMGIRTVINLRAGSDDISRGKNTSLRLVNVEMTAWSIDDERILRVLALLREKQHGPFLIHCYHGSDRTGLIIAMHRILEEGWTKEDALAEMKNGGFGYHTFWRNISNYINKLNDTRIATLRKRLDQLAPRRK